MQKSVHSLREKNDEKLMQHLKDHSTYYNKIQQIRKYHRCNNKSINVLKITSNCNNINIDKEQYPLQNSKLCKNATD